MANGRCRLHGGLSTGAKGKQLSPGRKHSIYDSGLTDEDREFLQTTKLGQVDEELEVVRIQLNRAMTLKRKFEENPNDPSLAQLTKIVRERRAVKHNGEPMLDDMGQPVYELVEVSRELAIPNLDDRIYRWTTRIESLERTRRELNAKLDTTGGNIEVVGGLPEDPE